LNEDELSWPDLNTHTNEDEDELSWLGLNSQTSFDEGGNFNKNIDELTH